MASGLYADMFATMYREERTKKARVRGFEEGGVWCNEDAWRVQRRRHGASIECLALGEGPRAAEERLRPGLTAPTTTPPQTPGSMSSEHSFAATSAPAPQAPTLAAQPGGISPYVPRRRVRIHLQSSSAHCKQERGRAGADAGTGTSVIPKAAREQGL